MNLISGERRWDGNKEHGKGYWLALPCVSPPREVAGDCRVDEEPRGDLSGSADFGVAGILEDRRLASL